MYLVTSNNLPENAMSQYKINFVVYPASLQGVERVILELCSIAGTHTNRTPDYNNKQ